MPEQAAAGKSRPKFTAVLSTLAAVLMSGLAIGAFWCLLSLHTNRDTSILIVPMAAAIGAFMRWQKLRGGTGMACALGATVLAFAYAQYLFAAVRVAQVLGLSLRKTLFKLDFGLAMQVARANVSIADIGWLVLGCGISVLLIPRQR